ncbi:MAG: hypothetical protein QW041_01340 [Candidatus Pacearchaeota archaeon]
MLINRKAQNVPFLIIIIGLLLAIYVYFMPFDEKCKLIPSLPECKKELKVKVIEFIPGLLEEQETAARYFLPDIQLFRKDVVDIATVLENTKVSRGWFFSSSGEEVFNAQENAREAKLFIFVNKAEGGLKIYINNKKIGTIYGEGVHQIYLDVNDIKETNKIKVIPTIPLFPFFLNDYEIGKIILKENYIITNNRVNLPFFITQNKNDILDIKLNFKTRCFTEENLSVYINSEKILEDKVCRGFSKDVFSLIKFNNMSGNITFASEGNYIIREITLDVRMKERTWPIYYFYLEKIEKPMTLKLEFNETGLKQLTAYVNGNALSVETTKKEWKTIINRYLIENATNSILLIPKKTVIIEKLEVE